MKRLLFLSVLFLLALCACAPAEEETGEYQVYFISDPAGKEVRAGGSALESEGRSLPEGADPAEGLMECLLSGPLSGALRSPIPEGVRQLSAPTIEDGVCRVDLSEGYGSLSGVELTLADYCIALTLCQLPGVDAVTIDVEGEPIPYRARQVLRPEDAALTGGEDAPIRLDASLYYLNADGSALVPEQREVAVTENGGQAAALLAAFLEGPREEGLRLPLAEGTVLLSVWTEGEVCYVNFSAPFRDEPPESPREARLLLYAIVDTMCQLPGWDRSTCWWRGSPWSSSPTSPPPPPWSPTGAWWRRTPVDKAGNGGYSDKVYLR